MGNGAALRQCLAKKEKGSIMIELCAVCTILVVFFMFVCETALYIRDIIHVQQVAREGAREACIISSSARFSNPEEIGNEAAWNCFTTYYGEQDSAAIDVIDSNGSFTCSVNYRHHFMFAPHFARIIHASAIYPDYSHR